MSEKQIFGLTFQAVKIPVVRGAQGYVWQAKLNEKILDNISKPSRRELWEDWENVARICGEERFLKDLS